VQDRQKPTEAAIRGAGTAALLLVFCCAPAFSAGSDVLCTQSTSVRITLDIPVDELAVRFVDLGTATSVPGEDSLPGMLDDLASRAPSVSTTLRVERILREIFDESVPADHEATDATPSSAPNAAPLAELTAPDLREKSRDIGESRIRDADDDVTGVTSSIPGLSEDELARYRRQMLRTDI
jgi:hypothetical protein